MTEPNSPSGKEMPFVQHLLELRDRLLKIVLAVVIILLVLMPFTNPLFSFVATPLLDLMSAAGSKMIAIDVVSPFFTPFKLTLVVAIFLAMPVILYHLWAFVAPGLYEHEKSLIFPLLVSSTFLFYLGMLFAYVVVLPMVFGFMMYTTPVGVEMMTDISRYLDFVLTIFFAFGIAFQVPVATVILVWLEIITPEWLAEKRPYIIVLAFVVGMLMTPPDVISQTLLAVPMWLLFEVGLLLARIALSKKKSTATTEEGTNYPVLNLDEMDAKLTHHDKGDGNKK
jgi:sec-independent protein translocase protein TatC